MDIQKQPKKETIHLDQPIKREHTVHNKTVREFLTDEDHNPAIIPMMMDLAKNKREMKWSKYLDFFRANMSGDISSMNEENILFVEKMKKELTAKLNEQTLL